VAENSFQAKEKGKIKPDSVNVLLSGGRVFEGWKNVTIQKNMESIANGFSFEIDDRFAESNSDWLLKPGQWVAISVGSERVVTGYIEKVTAAFDAGSRQYSIEGRSKPGDLVDCSVEGAAEYSGEKIEAIAEKLVKPFGIKIFTSVESSVVNTFGIKVGESVFTALNRLARLQGFFWVSTRAGNIRLTRPGRARAFTTLEENVNLLSGSIEIDTTERFSSYEVKGQSAGTNSFNLGNAAHPQGKATDLGITRHRPLCVIAEGPVDAATSQTRAEWESTSRFAKGMSVDVIVQGWRQENGILWGINQIVRLKSKYLGLNTDMLITQVEHSQSESGTVTNMTLKNKNSFIPKKVIKKEDDILARLSANVKKQQK